MVVLAWSYIYDQTVMLPPDCLEGVHSVVEVDHDNLGLDVEPVPDFETHFLQSTLNTWLRVFYIWPAMPIILM